jgi:hypothetical protein
MFALHADRPQWAHWKNRANSEEIVRRR